MSLALLPLLFASLQWNTLPGAVMIGYPSVGMTERACINDDYCWTPENQQGEMKEWNGAVYYVTARVRLPDGSLQFYVAVPIKNFEG